MNPIKICVLAGDGVGPEITAEALKTLQSVCRTRSIPLDLTEGLIGGCAIDAEGIPLSPATVEKCRMSGAVLLGAVGGPQWDCQPANLRPEAGLLAIRNKLGLFANLRPARVFPALQNASPLKNEIIARGVDLLVVRELTGGIYFGEKGQTEVDGNPSAYDKMLYSEYEVERIAKVAFEAAQKRRGKVTCVDKANVLETSRLWRRVVDRVRERYPEVELNYLYVDNAAMQLLRDPSQFDVLLTENMFGDILSDESAMLAGSIGMLPSASTGHGTLGLYEPIHGSAPDIAGKGIVNPLATILSVAMMLRYSFSLEEEACAVEQAVEESLAFGRTPDLADPAYPAKSTQEIGDFVAARAAEILA
ncbi:3-isopropylmalate dehydrogenase [Clostridiaceae bacterium NSJ-31]|uniref:3-isopropylmalate dehydrogenase n=1 Tax=Ligaoa zhengdingensis TaxID=2763658 RepID=A0A926DXM8_9FIRM|nr:3-isopropylmalate dehydrogenase [Ligaoa zhengdingensis]MBC8545727.1 3-isopropylmalate dehydrogenase [Ligaoa zhengdingensis]